VINRLHILIEAVLLETSNIRDNNDSTERIFNTIRKGVKAISFVIRNAKYLELNVSLRDWI